MVVPPGTRVWPFGRILRLIAQEKFSWLHRGGTATVPRPVSPARPGTSQAAKVSGKGA